MKSSAPSLSRYDQRVRLAADALMRDWDLSDDVAVRYAKKVLHVVDHVPEHIR